MPREYNNAPKRLKAGSKPGGVAEALFYTFDIHWDDFAISALCLGLNVYRASVYGCCKRICRRSLLRDSFLSQLGVSIAVFRIQIQARFFLIFLIDTPGQYRVQTKTCGQ